MPDVLRVNEFQTICLGQGDRATIDLNVLPGHVWRVHMTGQGTVNQEDLQHDLNRWAEANLGLGNGNPYGYMGEIRIIFNYDVGRRTLVATHMERRAYEYVEATTFGVRYANYLPTYGPLDYQTAEEAMATQLRKREAQKKAEETLTRMLTEEQRKDYKEYGHFFLTGSEGTRYKIHNRSYSGNVHWVDKKGNTKARFCAHPNLTGRDLDGKRGLIPIGDAIIGQKLMLETDEVSFLSVANLFEGTYPPCVRTPAAAGRFPRLGGVRRRQRRRQIFMAAICAPSIAFDVWAGSSNTTSVAWMVFEYACAGFVAASWWFTARRTWR